MDGVTLLESGTHRAHFALVKRVERAESDEAADRIIADAVASVRQELAGASKSFLPATTPLSAQLLVLLHAVSVYPHSAASVQKPLDLAFALTPTLTLLATAKGAKELQIAYTLLHALPGIKRTEESVHDVSLLLVNTIREHLGNRIQDHSKGKGKGRIREQDEESHQSSPLDRARRVYALRSIINGLPAGPDCVPALYGPTSGLLSDDDVAVKALAMQALDVLSSYRREPEGGEARARFNRLDNVLAIPTETAKLVHATNMTRVPEVLASAYLSSVRSAQSFGVISQLEALEAITRLVQPAHSQCIVITGLRDARKLIESEADKRDRKIEGQLLRWCGVLLETHLQELPVLLEVSRLLGVLSEAIESAASIRSALWAAVTPQLAATSPRRIFFSVQALHALLPLGWASASSEGEEEGISDQVRLDETQMQQVLSFLVHADSSIRRATLHLMKDIDADFLPQHLASIQTALRNADRHNEQEVLLVRAVEVLGVMVLGSSHEDRARHYAESLAEVLSFQSHASDDVLAPEIVMTLQQVTRKEAIEVVQSLIGLLDEQKGLSEHALLLATLTCSLELEASVLVDAVDDLLVQSSGYLARVSTKASIQEAWLVAIARLMPFASNRGVDASFSVLSDFKQSVTSSSVKTRVAQVEALGATDRSSWQPHFRSATILDTLDALERCGTALFVETRTQPARQHRPLRYDAYERGSPQPSNTAGRSSKLDGDVRDSTIRKQPSNDLLA